MSMSPILDRSFSGGHKEIITSVAFHPCPSELASRKRRSSVVNPVQIASASSDGGLTLWNYHSGDKEVKAFRFQGHDATINHLSYSPTGHLLASCSSDKSVKLWVPKIKGENVVLKGHNGAVRCVDFSNHRVEEDSLLVTCSDDKTLKLWNLRDKSFRRSMVGHKNWVRSCNFSSDSKFIISGSDDGTIKLWDVNNGDTIVTYKFPPSSISYPTSSFEAISVRHVRFHPIGNILAASGSDGNVHIYDLRSDRLVHSITNLSNKQGSSPASISFHPDAKHLMSSTKEGMFGLWDMRTWTCSFSVNHHSKVKKTMSKEGKTYCCDISSDGSKFVTGGPDKKVATWKVNLQNTTLPNSPQHITIPLNNRNNQQQSNNLEENEQVEHDIQSDIYFENVNIETKPLAQNNDKNKMTATEQIQYDTKQDKSTDELILPKPLERIIDHIISQLDTITSSMIKIEKRLTIQEDYMSKLKSKVLKNDEK